MGNILTISIYNYRSGQIGYSIEHVPIPVSGLILPGRRHVIPAPDFEARRQYPQEDHQYQQGLKPLNDSNRIHTYTR